jgi:MATE family multidrug resistance protein
MLSLPFLAGFNALKQFAEAVGHTTLPMRVMIVSNILNIALNALLIYGIAGMPEWGLFGAGMATFIARVFLFAAMLFAVFHGKKFKLWTRKSQHSSTTRKGCTHMAMVGFPIAIQLCLESASFNIAGMFMGWIGDIQLAAHQVMCSISTLIFMIQYGIGAAAAIRISQFRGRGEWSDVKRTVHSAWALAILFAIVSVGAIAIFCQPITSIFTSDNRVQNICFLLLPAFVLYQLGDCTQIIFSNSLRAIEAVGRMLLYAIIAYLLVSIPMSYLLGIHLAFGAEGVWYGIPLGLTTAALLFMYEFRRKIKQLI